MPKIRAFLDTNVLLEYLQGKVELQQLFSEEVRKRAAFAINAIVLQELLLARDKVDGAFDPNTFAPYVELLADPDPRALTADLPLVRERAMHVNDVLILAGARDCDVLLTYDSNLLDASAAAAVRSETPEEFLEELGTAA